MDGLLGLSLKSADDVIKAVTAKRELLSNIDQYGCTLTHYAIMNQKEALAIKLVDMGASVFIIVPKDCKRSNLAGLTPFHLAASRGMHSFVKAVLHGRDEADRRRLVEFKSITGHLASHIAAREGHTSVFHTLVTTNRHLLTLGDTQGWTPLHHAAFNDHLGTVAYILNQGGAGTLDAPNTTGRTPLHEAARNESAGAVKMLLAHGASYAIKDEAGKAPIHVAKEEGNKVSRGVLARAAVFHFVLLGWVRAKGKGPAGKTWRFEKHPWFRPPWNYWVLSLLPAVIYLFSMVWHLRPTLADAPQSILFIVYAFTFILLLSLHTILWRSDPGRLPRLSKPAYLRHVDAGDQVCHTCQAVKLVRSKHCGKCGVCVSRMDHHCSWVGSCIGSSNHRLFIIFVTVQTAFLYTSLFVIPALIVLDPQIYRTSLSLVSISETVAWMVAKYLPSAFLGLLLLVFSLPVTLLLRNHVKQIRVNVTTNEGINRDKYAYMTDLDGKLVSPFSSGQKSNCVDFLRGYKMWQDAGMSKNWEAKLNAIQINKMKARLMGRAATLRAQRADGKV